jgi:hypothetical protein
MMFSFFSFYVAAFLDKNLEIKISRKKSGSREKSRDLEIKVGIPRKKVWIPKINILQRCPLPATVGFGTCFAEIKSFVV